ncbi:alpha/beta hydrolase [Nakamurella sp.]|uniref:alpha/beta hydrolase n=1 Tax=Nakamurella sp. TaxID=1869182 RepID=UPI003B3A1C0D
MTVSTDRNADDRSGAPGAAPVGAEPGPPAPPDRERRRRFRYTLPGAWVAVVFVCLSFTPSLVPRPGAFMGVVCGINGAIGYGLGVLGAWVWREVADRPVRPTRRRSWRIFAAAGPVLLVAGYLLGQRWQGQIRDLMGAPAEPLASRLLAPVVAALVFAGLVAVGRLLRRGYRWTARQLSRWIGARAARVVGWALVVVLTVGLVSGVLLDGVLGLTDRIFAVRDTTTNEQAVPPTTGARSGGPGSLVAWDTLGYQGRTFIGTGPTAAEIGAFTGAPAKEPIRTYAGIASAGTAEERAELAVADLTRAGGFDRAALLVTGTTGTGWVDPAAIAAFEYETGGDSAAVAIQYSYLPSWASFLVDQDRAREAGRALFDAVYRTWSELPADRRPALYAFGLSLGSFAMETAFSGEADMANRTSGILLAGPPSSNALHREFTDRRDPGSPEVQPVLRDGRTVRFANDPGVAIPPEGAPWTGSRVLYLQHASDPVTWLNPDLILHRPDWLAEPPGPDVTDEMVWIPFVTFWQVAADMLEPVDTPPGHGHTYTLEFVDGWAAVLQPPGWTTDQADRLKEIVGALSG